MATGLLSFLSHDAAGVLYSNTVCIHTEGTLGGPDESDPQVIVDECSTWLTGHYRDWLSSALVLDGLKYVGVGADHGLEAFHTVNLAGLKTGMDGKLARELAVIVSWKTNQHTRSGRGHIALPVPRHSTAFDSSGIYDFDSVAFNNLGALADAFLAGHTFTHDAFEQHSSLRIWSRKLQESYDVRAYTLSKQPRWVERRQTAP